MINKYFDSCTLLILKSFEKVTDFEYKLMFEKILETVLFGQKICQKSAKQIVLLKNWQRARVMNQMVQ